MISILRTIPLFEGLDDAALHVLDQHVAIRTYPKHSPVIHEGDDSSSLYIILEGKVKVFLRDEHGKEVILNFLGPKEYFGELALMDEGPRSAFVMTLEPSKFCVISRRDFLQCLAVHPDIGYKLIKHLSRCLRKLTNNVKSLALMDVYGRVARTLLQFAKAEGNRLIVTERLTHQDIANLVGSSREMVSRIMKDLISGNYISVEDKTIIIHDRLPPAW